MSQRVIGYEGEGRVRRPLYQPEEPAVARSTGYVANASSRGFAVTGGALVQGGPGEYDRQRAAAKAYQARRRSGQS